MNGSLHAAVLQAAREHDSAPLPPVAGPLTVVFTALGQDFLEWDVDAQGVVTVSRPMQTWVWAGMQLTRQPRVGEQLEYRNDSGQVHTIRYPVREVRALSAAPASTESP